MNKRITWTVGACFTLIVVVMLFLYVKWQNDLVPMTDAIRAQAGISTISTTSGKIAYQWAGPDTGQVVVMIPGFSVTSEGFRKNAAYLAEKGFRVLTFDHFGRGYSDRPSARYDAGFYELELRALWNELSLPDTSYLVGFSMGGAIAAHFTAKHPSLIKKLCLIAPAGMWTPRYALIKLLKIPGLGDWITLGPMRSRLIGGLRNKLNQGLIREELFQSYYAQFSYQGTTEAILSTLRHYPLGGLTHSYKIVHELAVPVKVIWGEFDQSVPYKLHEKVLEVLPNANLFTVHGAGHGIPYTHSGVVNRQLHQFFIEKNR